MSTHFLRISRNRSQKSSHSERKSSCLLIIFTFFLCSSLLFSYRKNPRTAPQPFHLSLPPGDKLRHGLHRPGLLFLRRDSRRRVPLLGAVIAELGMVAALELLSGFEPETSSLPTDWESEVFCFRALLCLLPFDGPHYLALLCPLFTPARFPVWVSVWVSKNGSSQNLHYNKQSAIFYS